MVVARAYAGVDMGLESTSYVAPFFPPAFVTATTTTIEILDPLGRLQRYQGSFNLQDLFQGKHSTSLFTGYQQFAGGSAATPMLYELSGASLNGQVLVDFIRVGNVYGLVAELFKGGDRIDGSDQVDTLNGFAGDDVIRGGDGDDLLFGGDGHDLIAGNLGDDTIEGGAGADTLRGGQGEDLLRGGDGSDLLIGDLGDDFLNGNLGSDSLDGGAGNDMLQGGLGDDLIIGGEGNDRLLGNLGNDTLNGNAGEDTLIGGLGADRFILSKGFDVIADFSATEGDRVAIAASASLYTLLDSAEGLQIIRAGFGVTTLAGITSVGFDEASSIILI